MDTSKLLPVAITVGIALAVAKFVPNAMVKAAAYGVAGVAIGKQLPFVKAAL
ncbi:hypothetical protein [Hydrogenophaga sp. PBC]|uniref:hypothetical protein n=1 Tax=Hydrogenophaga sp. PBC TaxID=795665 RepID=UPI000260772D|nr:hypothetical protein [Hydrogenophaga sp. PBC]